MVAYRLEDSATARPEEKEYCVGGGVTEVSSLAFKQHPIVDGSITSVCHVIA